MALRSKPHRPVIESDVARRQLLRSCLGRFATGVTVVTFDGPDGRHGFTANSFTAVSLDPPLVLVAVARQARAHDALVDTAFTVNVLRAEQEALARRFAGGDPVEPLWIEGDYAPRLANALAHLECLPSQRHDAGDHSLFVGEVMNFARDDGAALGYFASGFTTVSEPLLGHEYLI